MLSQFVLLSTLALALPEGEPVLDRPVPERVTGRDLTKALNLKVSASWRNVELRTILHRLSNQHQTAVLLDRSIDPNQQLDMDLSYQPLLAGFSAVAKSASADLCILGNTVYIGPAERVAKLRTLEHLRAREPFEREDQLPAGRMFAFSKTETVHWNDLEEPRKLVEELAAQGGIKILNPEAIPHDLWASATLPKATVTEALSLILIQFDLTFAWNEDTTEIHLVPVPETVAIEKAYTPPGGPSQKASRAVRERFLKTTAQTWEKQYPGLSTRVDAENDRILLKGPLELHEALSGMGRSKPRTNTAPANNTPPISKRQFTLRIERVPASALIKKLEESGIQFEYDEKQLLAQNIDLDEPISMNVKQADADEFFKALCEPLGLDFKIDNITVTLTPK